MSLEKRTTREVTKDAVRRVIDWTLMRKPLGPDELVLNTDALVWLSRVPVPVRPLLLSRRYPRIVNRLARDWDSTAKTLAYFNVLLTDQRGNRQGFSLELLQELVNLKAYYEEVLAPAASHDAWEDSHMF